MDSRLLRHFLTVAEYGSFTRAAEQLQLAQPAVSMSIAKLEKSLGVALFQRRDRTISLTDEGRALVHHARNVIQALDDAQREMADIKGLQQGEVRIGIPSMLGSYYFPPLLMAFRHRYPKLKMKIVEGGTWQLQQMLEAGEIDLSVIVDDGTLSGLETLQILKEQMLVTVAEDHPFAQQKGGIRPEAFFGEELVMFREGYFHRRIVDRLAMDLNVQPNIAFETNLIPLIKSVVRQGFGISTLMDMVIDPEDQIATRPFNPAIWLDLKIAWRRGSYLTKANQAFIDFMLEQKRPD
jgi:DNA-binding transcriptional LysR family regulator